MIRTKYGWATKENSYSGDQLCDELKKHISLLQ